MKSIGGEPLEPINPTTNPPEDNRFQKEYLRGMFKTAMLAGTLVLVTYVSANLLGVLFQVLSLSTPLFHGLSSGMTDFFSSYLVCIVGDVLAIGLGLLIFRQAPLKGMFGAPQASGSYLWLGVFGVLGAASIGASIFGTLYLPFYYAGHEMVEDFITLPHGEPLPMALIGLYICVLGPILEEILFRGILLRALAPYGTMTAIILSAFFFTLFHFNPLQLFTPLIMGLLAAFLAVQTKSLWPTIVAHMLNNTLALLPGFFLEPNSAQYDTVTSALNQLVLIVGIIVLVIFAYRYGRQFVRLYRQEPFETGIPVGAKLQKAVLNPVTIVLLLCYLVNSALVFYNYFL